MGRRHKYPEICDEGAYELLYQIVHRARMDYIKSPVGSEIEMESERFLKSRNFKRLTDLDGGRLLDQLKQEKKQRKRSEDDVSTDDC